VPERLRGSLGGIDGCLVLLSSATGPLELVYEGRGGRRTVARLRPAEDLERDVARASMLAADWRRRVGRICVRVAADRALNRVAALPLAAERNLAQVVSFELDRQTPFKPQEAYFTFRKLRRDAAARRLLVELTVVPRALVAEILELARRIGLEPDAIEVESPTGAPPRLLEGRSLSGRQRLARTLLAGLAGAAAVLAVAALLIPLHYAHVAAESLAQELALAKRQADAASQLQKQIETQIQESHSLLARKRQASSVSGVLATLTQAVSDDTWLAELQIGGVEVQMTGSTASASDLIGHLDRSGRFTNAAFRSTVTQDAKTGREQFSIAVKVAP
jgi:general secretion pathway protein L